MMRSLSLLTVYLRETSIPQDVRVNHPISLMKSQCLLIRRIFALELGHSNEDVKDVIWTETFIPAGYRVILMLLLNGFMRSEKRMI